MRKGKLKIIKRKRGKNMKENSKLLKGWKQFLKEEEGMGTVEVILIIVEIFTLRK